MAASDYLNWQLLHAYICTLWKDLDRYLIYLIEDIVRLTLTTHVIDAFQSFIMMKKMRHLATAWALFDQLPDYINF
jgi:hypothetical protein